MTTFVDKMSRGSVPTAEDWKQHLLSAHKNAPRMTPFAFGANKTSAGHSSYEILASTVNVKEGAHVVDLACGDGHLIQYLLPRIGTGKITGLDMSDAELDFAKRTYHGDERIEFACAGAEKMPFGDRSVDHMLCHMAFMLMLPIDPVVAEIARVLKPDGEFSAVIGNPKGAKGFFRAIQTTVQSHVKSAFANVADIPTGDPRVQMPESLQKLFPRSEFSPLIDYSDINLKYRTKPAEVWALMEHTYLVDALPAEAKTALKSDLERMTRAEMGLGNFVEFEFPLKMFRIRRR